MRFDNYVFEDFWIMTLFFPLIYLSIHLIWRLQLPPSSPPVHPYTSLSPLLSSLWEAEVFLGYHYTLDIKLQQNLMHPRSLRPNVSLIKSHFNPCWCGSRNVTISVFKIPYRTEWSLLWWVYSIMLKRMQYYCWMKLLSVPL